MAGDWIKIEKATLHKPEVLAISQILGIHPMHAFGLCAKFWIWCDDQIYDGNARGVTKVTLDFVIGHDGMADALVKVDWLRERSGSLEVPRFERHLSESAKNRALTKERAKKSKKNKTAKSNGDSVTKVTGDALPEKRREEKSTSPPFPPPGESTDGASSCPSQLKLFHETITPKGISFSSDEGITGITESDMERWAKAYPAVDLVRQIAAASEWLRSNPAKRKKNHFRFLVNWFAKEQERGGDLHSRPKANGSDWQQRKAARECPEPPRDFSEIPVHDMTNE